MEKSKSMIAHRKRYRISALFLILFVVLSMFSLSAYTQAEEEESDAIDPTEVGYGIPILYLNIDESQGTIKKMHDSTDHSDYCHGTMSISVPENFHYADFPDLDLQDLTDLTISIRGRGNSTWRMTNKKPYKIKLEDAAADVLGLGENKHWVLVANDFDATLMKDRITAWLGDEMGFDFTPRGVPVDVIMSGEFYGTHYLGSYYLSENVRVDKNRVSIEKLKEDDTDPDKITGGYLLQNAMQVRDGSPDRFYTDRGVDWATHTPSFDTEADALSDAPEEREDTFFGRELNDGYENHVQQEYIQDFMRHAEDVLFDGTTGYRDLFDVENAAKYWLVNEVSMNNDAFATGSTYIYKDRGSDTLYWGPLWDFDFAWTRNKTVTGINAGHKWMKPMLYDKEDGGFLQEVYQQWPIMKEKLEYMIAQDGLIDQYAAETRVSAKADHDQNHRKEDFTFDASVAELKQWIRNRIDWVDANISSLDDLVHRVTFMADGKVYAYDFMEASDYIDGKEPYPEIEGQTFLGWMDEEGNIIDSQINITKDMTITAKYVSDDSMTHVTDIAFNKASDVIRNSFFMKSYQIPYVLIPEDAEDQRIHWISSDSDLASVDDYGYVKYNGTGQVTFTAQLKHGTDRSFTLTIVEMNDDPYPFPTSVFPEKEEITLDEGEQSPFIIDTDPPNTKIQTYEYESEDPSVVTVGDCGVLTAVGPGRTKVRVRIKARDEHENEFWLETYTTVIVKGEEPEPAPAPSPAPGPEEKNSAYRLPMTGIE
ncbi:MAG: CotH kinase family protein [Erysipelotrichaceae bacterium]|nr:CotH kinase family protein [Erysipelotrichaceae bacterium]